MMDTLVVDMDFSAFRRTIDLRHHYNTRCSDSRRASESAVSSTLDSCPRPINPAECVATSIA